MSRDGDLSAMERDALTELVNIAVSGAASRLRAMVGSEVGLTVPVIDILKGTDATDTVTDLGHDRLVAVRQGFSGPLAGHTMLVFGEADSAVLARAVLGEAHAGDYGDLTDALAEIGNVVLLGFLAMIGSMLSLTFEVTVPTVVTTQPPDLFPVDQEQVILVVYMNFNLRQISARGYFSLILSLGSFESLRDIVNAFVEGLLRE
ncbi:MAG: chemotaxis protein CheX [Chloroflexota bacterium]